jgi:hypothetical protein
MSGHCRIYSKLPGLCIVDASTNSDIQGVPQRAQDYLEKFPFFISKISILL